MAGWIVRMAPHPGVVCFGEVWCRIFYDHHVTRASTAGEGFVEIATTRTLRGQWQGDAVLFVTFLSRRVRPTKGFDRRTTAKRL